MHTMVKTDARRHAHRSVYTKKILDECERQGSPTADARHVEAYLRLTYHTLDHLSLEDFQREITLALDCIDADPEGAEELARSYGF